MARGMEAVRAGVEGDREAGTLRAVDCGGLRRARSLRRRRSAVPSTDRLDPPRTIASFPMTTFAAHISRPISRRRRRRLPVCCVKYDVHHKETLRRLRQILFQEISTCLARISRGMPQFREVDEQLHVRWSVWRCHHLLGVTGLRVAGLEARVSRPRCCIYKLPSTLQMSPHSSTAFAFAFPFAFSFP